MLLIFSSVKDEKNKQNYLPRVVPTETVIEEGIVCKSQDNSSFLLLQGAASGDRRSATVGNKSIISYNFFPRLNQDLYLKINAPKNTSYKQKFEYKTDEVLFKYILI